MPSAEGDAIDGVDGTDTIDGGGGGDTISFSGAGSVARGGDGTDDITFHLPASSSPIMGTAYGDGGDDGVAFDVSYSQDQVTYSGNISLHGGEGSDTISGRGGIYSTPFQNTDVYLYGDGGNDRLEATAQNTFSNYMPYEGGGNDDFLYGGAGNDTYFVQEKQDVAIEKPGEGYDTVEVNNSSTSSYTLAPNVEKLVVWNSYYHFAASLSGNASANEIVGTYRSDSLDGAGGNDTIYGKPISETYVGNDDNDTIRGGDGNDLIYGAGGVTDTWDGSDTIYGDVGNDTLHGQQGNDTLYGGDGFDKLASGAGNDIYDFDYVTEPQSGAASRDMISDFAGVGAGAGDRIDLSGIDAIGGGGDDPFTFIGTAGFTAPGQVRVRDVSSTNANTLIQANTTGPSGPELEIVVADGSAAAPGQWAPGDFIL